MAEVKDLQSIQKEILLLSAESKQSVAGNGNRTVGDFKPTVTIPRYGLDGSGDRVMSVATKSAANPNRDAAANTDLNYAPNRKPWIMTCQKWLDESKSRAQSNLPSYIAFRANPSEIGIKVGLRASEVKSRSGTALHVWRREQNYSSTSTRSSYFDEIQLSLNFQSGNIMPMIVDASGNIVPPQGVDNFYTFMSLMDEQKILDNGATNLTYLIINSTLFPEMTLAGIFTPDGTSFTVSAENPHQIVSWSSTFTIYSTFPHLSDRKTLLDVFRNAGFGRI